MELSQQVGASYQTTSNSNMVQTNQQLTHYGFTYRVPSEEAWAQYLRSQISVIDQLYAAYPFSTHSDPKTFEAVLFNEINSIDADVYRAQIAFFNTILLSPISGVVTGVYKNPGESVRAGETVLRVEDNSKVLLVGTIVYPGSPG